MSKSISVGSNPTIRVGSVSGDLSIVGWDGSELLIKGDEDDIRFEQTGEKVSVSSTDDLSLRVPKGATLELDKLGGDVSIRGVTGGCEFKEVSGDLSIRDAGSIAIDKLDGDFSVASTTGDLFAKNIEGDMSLRDVNGNVTIEVISDDLSLRGLRGNLHVKSSHGDISINSVSGDVQIDSVADDLALRGAGGNVRVNVGEDVVVYLEPRAECEYSVHAGEDILLVLPKNINATLDIHGDGIVMDWKGVENDEATQRVVVLGDGSARITLNAGGEIRVSDRADAGESADEFGNFAGLNFDWSDFGERITRQVTQATSRAAKRAEEALRRAERHAARHVRGGQSGAGAGMGRWNWDVKGTPRPPASPMSPSEPVADEERMAILKMLSEKKISAEQAEQLLKALEGGV